MLLLLGIPAIPPDGGGDIIIARVRLHCESTDSTEINISTFDPDPTFELVAGFDGTIFDSEISPNIISINDYCEGDFDGDGDQDGTDAANFKSDFGRSDYSRPCISTTTTTLPSGCPGGMIDCSGTCIDPLTDREYCGATEGCLDGIVCADGEICVDGACTLNCQSGLINCDGKCIDPMTDEDYCGASEGCIGFMYTPCVAGEICVDGACALNCPSGLIECVGTCVNTNTDENHCGGCSSPCGSGEVCISGTCEVCSSDNNYEPCIINAECDSGCCCDEDGDLDGDRCHDQTYCVNILLNNCIETTTSSSSSSSTTTTIGCSGGECWGGDCGDPIICCCCSNIYFPGSTCEKRSLCNSPYYCED